MVSCIHMSMVITKQINSSKCMYPEGYTGKFRSLCIYISFYLIKTILFGHISRSTGSVRMCIDILLEHIDSFLSIMFSTSEFSKFSAVHQVFSNIFDMICQIITCSMYSLSIILFKSFILAKHSPNTTNNTSSDNFWSYNSQGTSKNFQSKRISSK